MEEISDALDRTGFTLERLEYLSAEMEQEAELNTGLMVRGPLIN
jgi:hypothetical protein